MTSRWNKFDAELADLMENERRKRPRPVRCRYCGHLTTRKDGVCPAHDDLPELEDENVRISSDAR